MVLESCRSNDIDLNSVMYFLTQIQAIQGPKVSAIVVFLKNT